MDVTLRFLPPPVPSVSIVSLSLFFLFFFFFFLFQTVGVFVVRWDDGLSGREVGGMRRVRGW